MATPRKPVRHGRERPAPEPLPIRTPPPSGTTPDTTAPPPSGTAPDTTAPLPSGTTPDTTAPTGATPLVIRVAYEPLSSLVELELRLTYEDPANGYRQDFTLSLRAADGPQQRAITILAPDPTHIQYRWSVRGFTGDGVVVESAAITAGDPKLTIDGALQAALLRK